jgi:hypothetical protein
MDVRDEGKRRETYVVKHFIDGVETREEALLAVSSHFVGYAWEAVFGADDAVVGGIEAEFYSLICGC